MADYRRGPKAPVSVALVSPEARAHAGWAWGPWGPLLRQLMDDWEGYILPSQLPASLLQHSRFSQPAPLMGVPLLLKLHWKHIRSVRLGSRGLCWRPCHCNSNSFTKTCPQQPPRSGGGLIAAASAVLWTSSLSFSFAHGLLTRSNVGQLLKYRVPHHGQLRTVLV